jgi:hypothetical protein
MKSATHLLRAASLSAMLAVTLASTPALAGNQTKAEAAIAEARGKIDAGDKVDVARQAPELQGQARAELRAAEEQLANHKKVDAIATAHHASELADQAIMTARDRRVAAERDRRLDTQDAANAAQQAATSANVRADSAQSAAITANNRADSAEHASAAANAQVDAMRNAPPAQPTTTTVAVTERSTVVAPKVMTRKVVPVRHRAVRAKVGTSHVKTTTVVTTTHP